MHIEHGQPLTFSRHAIPTCVESTKKKKNGIELTASAIDWVCVVQEAIHHTRWPQLHSDMLHKN